jgi:hypothetical protein
MFPLRQLRRWYLRFKLRAVTFDIDKIERELAHEFATKDIEPLVKDLERLSAERERLTAELAQT